MTDRNEHDPPSQGLRRIESWFASRGWHPFDFQRRAWSAYLDGRSGLVHAPTGMGKSMAVWLGPVIEAMNEADAPAVAGITRRRREHAEPIRVLWITPMRALASDTVKSLARPIEDLAIHWTVEKRTGDTAQSLRAKQRDRLPSCLVTTPESLTLLLSYPWARERFRTLRAVIVDEWHELLSTKRGTQTELALARVRRWNPAVRTWGLSATLGNLDEAMHTLLGPGEGARTDAALISGDDRKEISIATVLPPSIERFPWAGHLGLKLLERVLEQIESCGTSLLFTNTRSQAELWFQAISHARPDWLGRVAIHHGSIERDIREEVEQLLRTGELRCVVCTSSLDLGVDFSPVEQVIQIGSPKGVARLMQRAGRSGHQPGAISTVVCVPTNAMELLEFAAARRAVRAGMVESRRPLERPLDVLAQHVVTIASAEPFNERALFDEVRSTWAYRDLSEEEWRWTIDFASTGGSTLRAYPQYARLAHDERGLGLRVASTAIERTHRLGIGTITSEASMRVAYSNGRALGSIEEGFIARLRPGDRFVFAGQILELVRVHQMTAHVTKARRAGAVVPRWDGGRTPLSTHLARAVREKLSAARTHLSTRGEREPTAFDDPEMAAARPLLELQARWSRLPEPDELLIEHLRTREGFHTFLFPFDGRLVHEGLGALIAHRLTAAEPRSVSVTSNDMGIELLSPAPLPVDITTWRAILSPDNLLEDLASCLNSTELTRRQFRDIARVAGLIPPSFPGQRNARSARQMQASSELFFDVFTQFDPQNMLLAQARREVLEQQLELGRLRAATERLAAQRLLITEIPRLTPFCFALWAEGLRTQQVSSERWSDRVQKMVVLLEREAER